MLFSEIKAVKIVEILIKKTGNKAEKILMKKLGNFFLSKTSGGAKDFKGLASTFL